MKHVVVVAQCQADLQWRTRLTRPEENLLSIIEGLVFGTDMDVVLRTAVRNRKDTRSMFATQPLSAYVDDLDTSLKDGASTKDEYTLDNGGSAPDDNGGSAPIDEDMSDLPCEVRVEVNKAMKTLDDDEDKKTKLENFVAKCWRKIDTGVVLFQETADPDAMTARLKETEVNKMRAQDQPDDVTAKRFVLVVYDLKSAGESSSHPATRAPPLRNNGDHLKQCWRVAIDAGASNASIGSKDMYVTFDCGRSGLARENT